VIGIFLCAEDGVEVYPRQGKSIFPHQKYRLSFWTVGIFLCMEDGVEVYPRQGKSIFPHQKYRLSFWTVGIFLFREDAQTLGKCTELKKIWIASVNTAKKNRT